MTDVDQLTALPGTGLSNHNSQRQDGHEQTFLLSELPPKEAVTIREVYEDLCRWRVSPGDPEVWVDEEGAFQVLRSVQYKPMVERISRLGRNLIERPPSLARVIHDLRSGGVSNIVALLEVGLCEPEDARVSVRLAKDHAKLMRGLFEDLEPEQRSYDEAKRVHHSQDYFRSWSGRRLRGANGWVRVDVLNRFDGYLTERCLETSALDRVLYNLVNNALRFCADRQIRIVALPNDENTVRVCVLNSITQEQATWLEARLEEDPAALFRGGQTVGGHGIGLASCACIVGQAFGVDSVDSLVEEGYIGSRCIGLEYCSWFHWPALAEADQETRCGCDAH